MRKNDIITILQKIKGNPEIMLWNGFVEDCVPINPEIHTQVLLKEKASILRMMLEHCNVPEERILERIKKRKWEYRLTEEFTENYEKKTVYVIQPKITGKKYRDRLGSMEY